MKDKYSYDVCVFMFKVIRKIFPDWLYHFESVDSRPGMTTRQAKNIIVRRANTDIGAREMSTRGPQLWNNILSTLRDAASLMSFRNKMKKYLLYKNQ